MVTRELNWSLVLSIVIVTIMALTFSLGLYLIVWPVNVVDVESVEILTPIVYPGEVVRYKICYDKFLDIAGFATKILTGKDEDLVPRRYALSMTVGLFEKGISICVEESTQIPIYVVPGQYKVRYRIIYQINSLRTHTENFETTPFKVVARDVKK